ncbi:hypothetical protein CHI06_02930 [Bacillus sp. 7884-1]|nr:hypothetical protein CHI06_02930 [Bacillus sp. 7884-1]
MFDKYQHKRISVIYFTTILMKCAYLEDILCKKFSLLGYPIRNQVIFQMEEKMYNGRHTLV